MSRFWSKVSIRSKEECWNWTACISRGGYGRFGFNGKVVNAQRVAYQLRFGEIPAGMFVLHRCDNRRCVNPNHLFVGTHEDNMADMSRKGRQRTNPENIRPRIGEDGNRAVLTERQVIEIISKKGSATCGEVSRLYGVSSAAIWLIWAGRNWRHIPRRDG